MRNIVHVIIPFDTSRKYVKHLQLQSHILCEWQCVYIILGMLYAFDIKFYQLNQLIIFDEVYGHTSSKNKRTDWFNKWNEEGNIFLLKVICNVHNFMPEMKKMSILLLIIMHP